MKIAIWVSCSIASMIWLALSQVVFTWDDTPVMHFMAWGLFLVFLSTPAFMEEGVK